MARTMVILAAGMGSRFGGPKQLLPVGPNGETILDYNAHDAVAAGFGRIVIVTRAELHAEVSALVERGVGRVAEAVVVLQHVPPGRTKPLGTCDAVLAAGPHVDGVFGVANADDLYGAGAFAAVGAAVSDDGAAVLGLPLSSTVPREGAVSRAVLEVGADDRVLAIREVAGITASSLASRADDAFVSMNLWGFPSSALDDLAEVARRFVPVDATAELFLPDVVGDLVGAGRLRVRLVPSPDPWTGMTNPGDVEAVRADACRRWPSPLW